MDSDLHRKHHHYHHNNHHQPPQPTGLTRYRSAPSSYFSDLINNGLFGDDDNDPFFNSRVSNTETEKSLMKFMSSFSAAAAGSGAGGGDSAAAGGSGSSAGGGSTAQQIMNQIGGFEPQFVDNVKQEPTVYQNHNQNQNQFQSQSDYNNQPVSNSTGSSTIEDSMDLPGSLLRQNSSPAGFVDHGYPLMRSMDDFRASRGNVPSSMMTSAKRMKNEMGYSSGSQLSSGMLPRIPENESKVMEMKSVRNDGGFGSNSWDESDILSDSFLKEFGEVDQNSLSSLNSSDNQRNDVGRIRAPTTLVHHLSLPASTAELDKLLQFPDSVPLKSRAKRGCATHPRSISPRGERGRSPGITSVRRTRISERMRKLQDLVPNMDKQTNTADMLDLAVDYIKELQKEAEALSDHHAKCTCAHKQKV
ncbi:putative transcription factor bHLH family [Helianthus annuus]|uniref:Transcription factor bHLH family n=1 Tax=Helianthus annuus TaxID=4232 RepID=A0A9K3EHX9_HELAN|nr:putative transcription factor bHLH family [Helianthus annuus]KAJ0476990.1 putative transcription factor bHLH family [Helianthus annuus]KAJ0497818.1 putative transcription factor bHLH family [Helianthus annuus]KAJ0663827.1 putative transcription factor bHLH family [Helianthus annuus]KAJ0671314.1 putative transcription factor bHLH family [Helianthus annuus]